MIIVERILKFENLKIKQINKNKNKENNVQRIVNSKIYISDHLVKLVVVGNSGVGKSSLMVRFSDDQFNDSYHTTIGVDFRFKTLDMEGESVKIQIWDTAGQERFRTITNAYYKGADGIIMVYDKNDLQSFDDINTYWINEVENYGEKNVSILLLANKADIQGGQIDKEKAQAYAQEKNLLYYETSAKENQNVQTAFLELTKQILAKRQQNPQQNKKKKLDLKKITTDAPKQQGMCC